MIVSSISCLTVVSSAAVVDGGYEYDENDVVTSTYWELDDAGVLTIYMDTTPTWLDHASEIKKVVLEAGVTQIPAGAFYECTNLTSIDTTKADNDLITIGSSAFVGCYSLKNFSTSAWLDVIGAGAFQGSGVEVIDIAYVNELPDYGFFECDNLKQVYIRGGLVTVGKNVFKGCDNLEYVWFGNGVLNVGYGMFEDCVKLSVIELPDSLLTIGELAFDDCVSLTEITVPDSVETVGRYAFHNCSSATYAYIGHNAESIDEYAFYGCSSLENVKIACAMRVYPEGMFMDCTSLTTLDVEPSVETIGKYAFKNCTSLTEYNVPVTAKSIGDSAFDNTALTVFNVPFGVESIGAGVFTKCDDLTDINVDTKNRYYVSVDGALYDMALETLLCCPAGKTGTYTVYKATTTIIDDAFIGCDKLEVVEIPDSVETIADNAFNGCPADLVIKAGCTSAAAAFAEKRSIAFEAVHSDETKWMTTLEPTCEDEGAKSRVCSLCGYSFETTAIDAIGHQYDSGVVTKKATCEEDGVVTFTCVRTDCGDFYTEVLPKTEHRYDLGVVIVNPTCDTEGTKRFTCQNEGCYAYYDIPVKALGHSYDAGVVTTPATCETDGVMTFTCTRTDCGDSYTEVIPATGHAYDNGVVTTPATCDEDGVMTFTCANCGDTYTEVIPAIGHNYVESVVKPATCVENGKNRFTCINCNDSYDVVTTGEHQLYEADVTVKPTCTEEGKTGKMCAICKQFVGAVDTVPALGHNYNNGTCGNCGDKDPDYKVVRPSTPKMKLIRNEVKGITVTWIAVDGADHYRVYRRGAGDKSWTYIGDVDTNACLDTRATTGNYWRYTVRAVSEAGLYSGYENGIYIKRVDTPHMKTIANTSNGIKVTWSAVSNAKEYRVYRRGAGGTWVYLGITTGTSYVDTAVKNAHGQYYRYTVRAVDGYYSNFESGIYIKRA